MECLSPADAERAQRRCADLPVLLILLCAAGVFLRSLESASKMDVGFRSRRVIMMAIDARLHRYTPEHSVQLLSAASECIATLPGVISTITDGVPLSMGHRSDGFEVPAVPSLRAKTASNSTWPGPTTSQHQVAQDRSHQSIAACYPEPRGREYQSRQPEDSPARILQKRDKTSGQEKSSSAFQNTLLLTGHCIR